MKSSRLPSSHCCHRESGGLSGYLYIFHLQRANCGCTLLTQSGGQLNCFSTNVGTQVMKQARLRFW